VEFTPRYDIGRSDYPEDLRAAATYLRDCQQRTYDGRITNNVLPRLIGYTQQGETENDERGGLTLHYEWTMFDTFLVTNRSLDHRVISARGAVRKFTQVLSIREAYVADPLDLRASVLANPLSAHVVVISNSIHQTPQREVLLHRRSDQVALYRKCYQSSASGFMQDSHRHPTTGHPDIFTCAVRETQQEVSDRLKLDRSDFKMVGIAMNWEDLDLNAYGFAETCIESRSLVAGFARDRSEGILKEIEFAPDPLLTHIATEDWEPMGAFAMCAALLAHFDVTDVEAAAQRVRTKGFADFYEAKRIHLRF